MRVPLSWLSELVELDETTPEHVHAALVRVGLEEEDVHGGDVTGPVVVGEVLEFTEEPQKNGKTIRYAQIATGPDEVRGIVCGASNFAVGDRVVVTLPGAVLPGGFEIAARTTYGHVSDGMMASERELGLGEGHDGIMVLPASMPGAPGDDALPLLGLDDVAIEVNVTPDRGYALSMRGIAREYAASTGREFADPVDAIHPSTPSGFSVTIDDDAPIRGSVGCQRFVARVVRGIDPTAPTPDWMVSRLRLAGIRSISLAVDITNHVMLELGSPLHGYDLSTLDGGIVVRRARSGERLTTLDGNDRELVPEDLLITDGSGPIGLAGVMGGAATEITDATRDVLVEAAWFEPITIARSARRHKLPSEASRRFERGVDPLVQEAAAERVVQLLVELAGGTADALGTVVGEPRLPAPVDFEPGFVARLTGADYTESEVRAAIMTTGSTIEDAGDTWRVTPPSWRSDIVDREGLVEEAARLVGYDRIPSLLPVAPPGRGLTRAQRLRRAVANTLAAGGLTEVLAPVFATEQQIALTGDEAVRLVNPLDGLRPWLRTSLVPGIVDIARRNLSRGFVDLALFELGAVFLPDGEHGTADVPSGASRPDDATLASLDDLPPQPLHVAGLWIGALTPKQPGQQAGLAGLADAIDGARRVALALGVELRVRQATRPWLHPGRAAELLIGDTVVGTAGELLPVVALEADLPRVVSVFEIDLDASIALARTGLETARIDGVPAATQDLSVVVRRDVPAGDVRAAVVEGAGVLLEHAQLVDDYRGIGLADDEKSLTFALRFRGAGTTLTAAEATEAKLAGLAVATERHGARLRE